MKKFFKNLMMILLLVNVISCGAITRKKIIDQKVTIRDSRNDALLEGVRVKLDNKIIGTTDTNGEVQFTVQEIDIVSNYVISLEKSGFQPVTVTVHNSPGGAYVGGGAALFLLGVIPGVISLAVDGATGTWYTFKQKLDIKLNPIQ
ncbi:MAG: hypothetical protein ACRCTJ_01540 [Brevinema sp.]